MFITMSLSQQDERHVKQQYELHDFKMNAYKKLKPFRFLQEVKI